LIPAPKAHPPQLIEADLRPISLTATLSKLLKSFVGSWILDRIEDKFDKHQYGALKGRFTTHAVVDVMDHWHKAVDDGKSVRVVFVDFDKAFDHIDHNVLVAKLIDYDLPHTVIRRICSFLHHRRPRVKTGDVMCEWLVKDSGMPQGSYLRPLMFITLVDSLRVSCMMNKFVDDTTLSQFIAKSGKSDMNACCDELVQRDQWP